MSFDELRRLYLFEGIGDDRLRALRDQSAEVSFQQGDILFGQGEPADFWWVLLEGRIELVRRVSQHDQTVALVLEHPGTWAGGFRAWVDSVGYVSTARAASSGRALRVPAAVLRDLVRSAFPLGFHLMTAFFRTVRSFEAASRNWEALIALGQLSAGLAHELNNPASAASRSVDALQSTSDALLSSLVQLANASMTADAFIALDALRRELRHPETTVDPVALSDIEDALTTWMQSHGVERPWELAPALAAAGVDAAWCERALHVLTGDTLRPGLEWVASAASTQSLLAEVKEATRRISELVGAVRSYSQLDRASTQLVDVTEGLESTLVMFGHRLRSGDVTVARQYGSDVPRLQANPAELNQVWTNLISNALDAMPDGGTLTLTTRVQGDDVIVDVADTGAGMTPEVKAHAFDSFFTTKDVGKGTGLGLDISRRIVVERHDGSIDIDSEPGRTVVSVRLPRRPGGAASSEAAAPEA
jgi:signal transduction histidine kinase